MDNTELERVHLAWNLSGGTIPFDYIEEQDEFKNFYKFIKGKTFDHLEDYEYEFKEIVGGKAVKSIKDTVAPNMCSFLNANGGRIIYGITNKERTIVGFKATPEDIDEIKRIVYDQLNNFNPKITPEIIEMNFMPLYLDDDNQLESHYVLEVLVHAPRDKSIIYFENGYKLYVRVNGKKQRLSGEAIVDHIINRHSTKK
ncbi:ATP-binding protein [Streptococcus agalactiae]|nr:ATP-binding protein [Streptococcus agalactiae]MDK8747569.1 ATP-binding protein [Streptococcus agalactiae]